MTGIKQHYQEIERYVEEYCKHIFDINIQKEMLEEFWDEFCVCKYKILGVVFTRHNETAKTLWAELDYRVRENEKNLGDNL